MKEAEAGIMKPVQHSRNEFTQGMATALPIVIGYLPIAITFGLITNQAGISIFHAILMSAMVYAGASQFMAVNMLVTGAGMIEIIFATFILNLRHFIMGLSLMNLLKKIPTLEKILISAGLTDETFALSFLKLKESSEGRGAPYLLGLVFAAYSSWVLGTGLGALVANFIPSSIGDSMAIALYAMFIGLLVPPIRAKYRVGLVVVVSMGLCYLFSQIMSSGWAIVFATILGGLSGMLFLRGDKE